MNIIKASIERPIAVIAAVLMVVMFGLVALDTIPIQLAPDVNRPVISVTTYWPSAAPAHASRIRLMKVIRGIMSRFRVGPRGGRAGRLPGKCFRRWLPPGRQERGRAAVCSGPVER